MTEIAASFTVRSLLDDVSSKHPDKVAIVIPDGLQLTYKGLLQEVDELAKILLSKGVSIGDVVSFVLPNGLSFLALFYAIISVRGIAAPLNPAYKIDDFLFYLKDTHAKAIIVPVGTNENDEAILAAKQLQVPIWYIHEDEHVKLDTGSSTDEYTGSKVAPDPEDIALILHTSGTTSLPKGVPLTHLNLAQSMLNIANTYELSVSDTTLLVMPLFHVHGLLGATCSTLVSAGTVVVPSRFSATTFWKNVQAYNVTWYSAVPTIHQILLLRADADKAPNDKFRFIRSCSSALAPVVYENLKERFGAPVLEAYGMTETSHQMTSNPLPSRGVAKVDSVGLSTNVEVSVRDLVEDVALPHGEKGEVCVRGKSVIKQYWNRPDATKTAFTATGWFRTGDEAILDEDGYLHLTGRIKELINRGGEKISPVELDSVLLAHPKVQDAVAFGAPDEKYGEQVNCAVILKEGETATEQDIIQHVASKLSAFKVPVKVFISDSFPRTATGKIQRRFVAEYFLGKKDK